MIEIFWRRRQKSNYAICSEAIYADIETSHNADYSKTWMVTCQIRFAGSYKVVRTPSEFIDYLQDKIDTFGLDEQKKIFVYFHNLSFDFSYLLPWVQLYLPGYETRNGLYDGRNRIINYTQGPFEFRCSYLLSACSLERWGEEMNAEHKKKVGLYDYEKLVFQDDEIDQDAALYDEYDVLSMEDCMRRQLDAYGDNLATIPLTSTAYIRRILRRSCSTDPNYRSDIFLRSRIDAECYDITIQSYAGGYTHQNRYLKGVTVIPGIVNRWNRRKLDLRGKRLKHKDFRSHYPTQMRKYPLPWGKVDYYYSIDEKEGYIAIKGRDITIEDLFKMWPEYTTISMIRIKDMKLKSENITMPFMQNSKMFDTSDGFRKANDNGRALRTWGEFTTYIDNLTLKIISEQYDFEYRILKVYRFENMPCPEPIAEVIDDLFKKKSDYKILYKQLRKEYGENDPRTIDALFNLGQAKKLLNAIYGCCSTAIVRTDDDIDWIKYYADLEKGGEAAELADPYKTIIAKTLEAKQEKIDKFYTSKNSFLPYQCGVMICALARYELYEYIKTIGYDNILYGDTDSLFYISDQEIEARVTALNAEKHATAPYILDANGEKVYYDVFEDEPEILAFRGLHSKCYAVIQDDGKRGELLATIAGVPKRTIIGMDGDEPIYLTREEELAGITPEDKMKGEDKYNPFDALENLKEGTKFKVNTGFSAKYINEPKAGLYEVDGHVVETSGGCIIRKLPEKVIHNFNTIEFNAEFSDLYLEGV